MLYPNN